MILALDILVFVVTAGFIWSVVNMIYEVIERFIK